MLQAETWIRLSKDALANAHKYYPLYLFLLIFGLVIIVEHNKWSMGWNVAITFFGWAMVIKSTIVLLAPQLMEPFIRLIDMSPIKNWIRTAGAVLATLGRSLFIRMYLTAGLDCNQPAIPPLPQRWDWFDTLSVHYATTRHSPAPYRCMRPGISCLTYCSWSQHT